MQIKLNNNEIADAILYYVENLLKLGRCEEEIQIKVDNNPVQIPKFFATVTLKDKKPEREVKEL